MPRSGLIGARSGRDRSVLGFLVGLGLTFACLGATSAARPPAVRYPALANWFDIDVGPARREVVLAVRAPDPRPRQVTVAAGGEQAVFVHRGPSARYVVDLGGRAGADGMLSVRVEPAAAVALDPGRGGDRSARPQVAWHAALPTLILPAPVAAGPGRPRAEASVDETDTSGLHRSGVPVRVMPMVSARAIATVAHGDRLIARCWVTGDVVTSGFADHPTGRDYESDVWFLVATPDGNGFIPDVRYSRRGATDRLGLPACS